MKVLNAVLLLGIFLSEILSAQVLNKLASPNPLQGRIGTASTPSIDAASINPSQAALMKTSDVQVSWSYKSSTFLMRYPRFDTHEKNQAGLGPIPMPAVLWKPTSSIGLSGLIVPFKIGQDISAKRLPIILLGQEQYVNLEGSGAVNGIAVVNFGYAFDPNLSIGAGIEYYSLKANVALASSDEGTKLADIETEIGHLLIKSGFKMKLHTDFSIGMNFGLFRSDSNSARVASVLATADSDNQLQSTVQDFLNPIRVGLTFHPNSRINISSDLEFVRAPKDQEAFSTVDLKNKVKDQSDTLSVYLGADFRIDSSWRSLFGFFYEPASVGPGSSGPAGKTGYGFMDLASNLGEAPEKPIWMVGGGFRYGFGSWDSPKEALKKGYDSKMAVDFGFLYGETSIGIDENGEQPGAYLVQRYQIPMKFSYKF